MNSPVENQAFRLELVSVDPDRKTATLKLRIRTDKRWVYFDDLTLEVGGTMVVRDNMPDGVPGMINGTSALPRDTYDELLKDEDNHG